jgi:hypothetical protein
LAQNKPLTPTQIKKAFYKQYGKAFNDAIKKVFGKDANKQGVLPQTLANAPKVDITKTSKEITEMKHSTVPLAGANKADMSAYPAGPIPAYNGTVFIASDFVNSGNTLEIFKTYAHELADLLDMQVNARETTYGDPHDSDNDPDTGQRVEKTMFP